MRTSHSSRSDRPAAIAQIAELRNRLAEAEATLDAICRGEVDAVLGTDGQVPPIYTLTGADHAYRVLIESMNEGALTLAADKVILYANRCFAEMVGLPLEQVIGSSFRRFLSADDRLLLRALLERAAKTGDKRQVLLTAANGRRIPVLVSIHPLVKSDAPGPAFTMVVTDMTEARRTEELLRGFSHRLVQALEDERGQVARELHDNVTQVLCAIGFRGQALADALAASAPSTRTELLRLCAVIGRTAKRVERISRNLRPSVLRELGLVAVLRQTGAKLATRTGVSIDVTDAPSDLVLHPDAELAFYRIFQEGLRNVEKHARARHVTVGLRRIGAFVELTIHDDGIGFVPDHQRPDKRRTKHRFGLVGMRERAASVGGAFEIESAVGRGTVVRVRIPNSRGAVRTA